MTAFPAAMAGATFWASIVGGEFHGVAGGQAMSRPGLPFEATRITYECLPRR
jgi:hypothetical protein